jgi:hypothetical protein
MSRETIILKVRSTMSGEIVSWHDISIHLVLDRKVWQLSAIF